MRRITLLVLFFAATMVRATAQTTATFEDLNLSKNDTFYVNYTAPGTDVGFIDGLCYFPCEYDTAYGYSFWGSGFVYSNMRDTVTSGPANEYAASTDSGYHSKTYVVATGQENYINLLSTAKNKPLQSVYITNATYAHNSMRDGDQFAKKFTTGDWFKLVISGYGQDTNKVQFLRDTVEVYLADFRSADSTQHYILNTWKNVNLAKLKDVDSITFTLSSSDTGAYGMNTPAYFCLDNLTTFETSASVANVSSFIAKVYPNPATNSLHISIKDNSVQQLVVTDMAGRTINTVQVNAPEMTINTASLAPGVYILQLSGIGNTGSIRFVKQ